MPMFCELLFDGIRRRERAPAADAKHNGKEKRERVLQGFLHKDRPA
jgi:hypothetical protein